jgi:hypothetical protein
MPKATVNENRHLAASKNHVGFARQITAIQAETQSSRMQRAPYGHLWRGAG